MEHVLLILPEHLCPYCDVHCDFRLKPASCHLYYHLLCKEFNMISTSDYVCVF
jgi:hypothetical protein